ncbi:MAG: hypothetical protein ACE5GX_04150 [Thermoanaerobaculia bacterium]
MSTWSAAAAMGNVTPEPPVAYSLEFDPRLVEDSVLAAVRSEALDENRRFHREREAIYEIADPATRESGFLDFYGRWFLRLGLGRPVRRAIGQYPSIGTDTSRALMVPVLKAGDEFADLQGYRAGDSRPILLLRIRVATLIASDRITHWLHRELLHIADMLDPEFGFERSLGADEDGPVMESLLRERYRALWDTTVDGRLEARGQLAPGQKRLRRADFLNCFRMLGGEGPTVFERFFNTRRPTHAELADFAAEPTPATEAGVSGRCPVCRMPSPHLEPNGAELATTVRQAIRRDFPDWDPARGLCLQCADLYSSGR